MKYVSIVVKRKVCSLRKQTKKPAVLSFVAALFLFTSFQASAQVYPFNLPASVTATFTINTSKSETFNNNLPAVNIDLGKGYGSFGYNHHNAKSFIRNYKPVTIRFTQGVWSNFYDYLSDGRRRTDEYDNKEFTAQVANNQNPSNCFPGFALIKAAITLLF